MKAWIEQEDENTTFNGATFVYLTDEELAYGRSIYADKFSTNVEYRELTDHEARAIFVLHYWYALRAYNSGIGLEGVGSVEINYSGAPKIKNLYLYAIDKDW